jgi:rhodanese-related sulfurtransferase
MLRDEKLIAKRDYVVIDVRDEDWVGGHIVKSVHEPSAEFMMNVDRLVKDIKDVPLVVFHCALSQMR